MASTVSDQVRARVESFVAELSELIRRSAMETVQNALSGGESDSPRRGRRPAAAAAAAAPARRAASVAPGPKPRAAGGGGGGGARAKGAKRSPEELEELTTQLLEYIKNNPGQRIEQIAEGLGTSTKELNLPAKKLLNTKAIKTKGHKRATQYLPR